MNECGYIFFGQWRSRSLTFNPSQVLVIVLVNAAKSYPENNFEQCSRLLKIIKQF